MFDGESLGGVFGRNVGDKRRSSQHSTLNIRVLRVMYALIKYIIKVKIKYLYIFYYQLTV